MLTAAVLWWPMTGTLRNSLRTSSLGKLSCLTRRNSLGMEQDGSTSSLTIFKILGCWLLRLCLNIFSPDKPRVGGSDSYREPDKVFCGPEYLAEGTFSGLAAARVGSVLSKLCRPFLSNLRVGFLETLLGHGLALLLMFPFWVYGVKLTELQCQGVIKQIVYIMHSQAFILLPKSTRI